MKKQSKKEEKRIWFLFLVVPEKKKPSEIALTLIDNVFLQQYSSFSFPFSDAYGLAEGFGTFLP